VSLLKELALLPVAPLRFTVWVAQQVAEESERQHTGPRARAQQLRRIDEARRRGEIGEETGARLEGRVLEAAVTEDETARPSVIGGPKAAPEQRPEEPPEEDERDG
jgi:gas vesicle protein GvpG